REWTRQFVYTLKAMVNTLTSPGNNYHVVIPTSNIPKNRAPIKLHSVLEDYSIEFTEEHRNEDGESQQQGDRDP
ncbi:unnamed protein product, partial [Heterosigma akashiwo]